MHTAPIILFVYNRPEHTRQTVTSLKANELAAESDLFIFSDAAKDERSVRAVSEVREYINTVEGFKSVRVVRREGNLGLANSIIDGVTKVCGEFGRVIVLEDDLVTSPYFLRYMNDALNQYEYDDRVASIHGYWYPVPEPVPETFFMRGASCWGWATWARGWKLFQKDGATSLSELRRKKLTRLFDLEGAVPYTWLLETQIAGKSDSWAIRWHASTFLEGCLQLSPGRSLVRNVGFDGSGIHTPVSNAWDTTVATSPVVVVRVEQKECLEARGALKRFYRTTKGHVLHRLLARSQRIFRRVASAIRG